MCWVLTIQLVELIFSCTLISWTFLEQLQPFFSCSFLLDSCSSFFVCFFKCHLFREVFPDNLKWGDPVTLLFSILNPGKNAWQFLPEVMNMFFCFFFLICFFHPQLNFKICKHRDQVYLVPHTLSEVWVILKRYQPDEVSCKNFSCLLGLYL